MKKQALKKGDSVVFNFAGETIRGEIVEFYKNKDRDMAIVASKGFRYPKEVKLLIKEKQVMKKTVFTTGYVLLILTVLSCIFGICGIYGSHEITAQKAIFMTQGFAYLLVIIGFPKIKIK